MIDLSPEHLAEVKRILLQQIPDCEVRAFGSRVDGRAHPNSDLDLVLRDVVPLDWRIIERLKDTFAGSDLPFLVDIIDWNAIDSTFRQVVQHRYEVVQEARPLLPVDPT